MRPSQYPKIAQFHERGEVDIMLGNFKLVSLKVTRRKRADERYALTFDNGGTYLMGDNVSLDVECPVLFNAICALKALKSTQPELFASKPIQQALKDLHTRYEAVTKV